MYVLERRAVQEAGKRPRYLWEQYAVCGRRDPLERVRMGLGGKSEWRVRKTAASCKLSGRAA